MLFSATASYSCTSYSDTELKYKYLRQVKISMDLINI